MTITEAVPFPSNDRSGDSSPGESRTVASFRGRLPQQSHPVERVEAVMRGLPSHGWTAGWLGRRDRALLVLSQYAGLSAAQIGALTAGDLTVAGGVATVRTSGGRTTLRPVDDDLLCGPCALARWVHALDLSVVYPDCRVIAAVIARAVPLNPESPHLCQSNNAITERANRVALLPPVDDWGHPVRATMGPTGPVATMTDDVRVQALEQRVQRLLDPARVL